MGAAAGLQVDAVDVDQAHAAGAARRLHAHAAHQRGIGIEFGIGNPAVPHRMRLCHQSCHSRCERFPVEGLSHVKVEPRIARRDAHDDAEKGETGDHRHRAVRSARP